MSDHYTAKDAEHAMSRLARFVGAHVHYLYDESYLDTSPSICALPAQHGDGGAWVLHHAYGQGYSIHAYSGGGETEPFGSTLCSARELCEKVNFAMQYGTMVHDCYSDAR